MVLICVTKKKKKQIVLPCMASLRALPKIFLKVFKIKKDFRKYTHLQIRCEHNRYFMSSIMFKCVGSTVAHSKNELGLILR